MDYPSRILMVKPNNFKLAYKINVHMNPSNKVNQEKALNQWFKLREIYEKLGFEVIVKEDHEKYPDMVFCANPIFTYPEGVILSEMKFKERKPEVAFYQKWLSHLKQIESSKEFEGMGDLLWNYPKEKLYGGHGFRTKASIYNELEKILDKPIIRLKLINDNFYHLDTCLSIINEDTALYVPSAFDKASIKKLQQEFTNLLEVDLDEALTFLACNAHSPDGKNVIIEAGAMKLQEALHNAGFKIHAVDTNEFLKSGGSIFCMKNQGWF